MVSRHDDALTIISEYLEVAALVSINRSDLIPGNSQNPLPPKVPA
jgi:hypothetical protein